MTKLSIVILYLVLLLICTPLDLEAQRSPVKLHFGPKIGLAKYSLSGSEVDHRTSRGSVLNSRSGLELGIVTKLEFYQLIYLRTELNYLQKGGHLEGGGWVYQDPVEVNYLNVPFLIGVTPGKSRHVAFSIEAGMAYNDLLSSTNTYSNDIVRDYYAITNSAIKSWLVGAEFAFSISRSMNLFVNYRYSKDLNFFHARRNDRNKENYELWNEGSSITCGFFFHPSRKGK